jgi:ATP-binding cassette subfamily B protein
VDPHLQAGEKVFAWLQLDLDAQLAFGKGLIAVTNHRLLAWVPGASSLSHWPYREGLTLRHHDHAGVGHLELIDRAGRLAVWHFTLGQNLQALRVMDQFALQQASHVSGKPVAEPDRNACPSCKAPLEPEQDECPICTKVIHTPPSTWTLFRLWRFARPYRGQLLAGFILTLLGTAASMVPPYLTMPLMDNILIPYQNGQAIDPGLVGLYLGGLFGAALMAWGLSWAKTYILALVSERIGADLRTTTYEHLLRLSL